MHGAIAMGWIGFNCSLPHKQSVIAYLDELGTSAAIIGAVYCVVRRGERLIGENTDGQGFLTALRPIVDPEGRRVTILGAGGAARALIWCSEPDQAYGALPIVLRYNLGHASSAGS